MQQSVHKPRCLRLFFLIGVAALAASCQNLDLPDSIHRLIGGQVVDYHILYNISGSASDEQGQPLPDIDIILMGKFVNTPSATFAQTDWPIDTVSTASDGTFHSSRRQVICPYLDAIASDPAGIYRSDTLRIQLSDSLSTHDIALPSFSLKKK